MIRQALVVLGCTLGAVGIIVLAALLQAQERVPIERWYQPGYQGDAMGNRFTATPSPVPTETAAGATPVDPYATMAATMRAPWEAIATTIAARTTMAARPAYTPIPPCAWGSPGCL